MSDQVAAAGLTFASALLEKTPGGAHLDDAAMRALDDKVKQVLDTCRAAWPTLHVAELDYVRAVAERLGEGGSFGERLDALHLSDLYLTTAVAAGDQAALQHVSEHLLPEVSASLKRIDGAPAIDDVRQVLRERLLLPSDGQPAQVAAYTGRGPLLHWLRAIAMRETLKLKGRDERRAEIEAHSLAGATPVVDLELEIIRRLHHDDFRQAFDAAFRELTPRERNLLRMHVLDGLNIDQIGAFYRTHRTTAFRWLEAAREGLSRGIRKALSKQLALSGRELESLMGLIRSQLDVSMRTLLPRSTQ